MIRGLYAAATALDAATVNHEMLAHNLAHSTTPGYKARGITAETFDRVLGRATAPVGEPLGTHITGQHSDFRLGAMQNTNHAYDLAIENDGFFVLNTPEGPVYTRNGNFRMTGDGQLVSQDGYALQGSAGPVAVPPGSTLVVAPDGTVSADGVAVNRLQIVRFQNPQQLQIAGPTLFKAPQQVAPQPVERGILQGFREASNVSPAEAMVGLITGQRYFEAAQRVLRTISDSIQLNTRPQ